MLQKAILINQFLKYNISKNEITHSHFKMETIICGNITSPTVATG